LAAAEAVKYLFFPVDGERRRFFLVKGAQTNKIPARFFKGQIFRSQFDNIHPVFDFFDFIVIKAH
jgi:hypothetical protein